MSENEKYYQGVYAGPLTQRATDYNGHEVIGVQISDEAPDGAVFFVTLDDHMQVSITPVIAASIMPYEPEEPPAVPEIEPADYAATRKSLEEIIGRILMNAPRDTDDLRTCALAMSELARVIDQQERASECSPDASQETEEKTEQIIHVNGGTVWTEQDFERQDTDFSHSICRTCGHFLQYDKPTWIPAQGCKQSLKGATCTIDKNTPENGMVYCIDYAKKETINDIDPDYAEDVR